jgi:cytochrome c oxidase cbb3-type subunit 3
MPAWQDALGGEPGVADTVQYVLSLSGRNVDPAAAERGKEKFQALCVACHGADGKGNQALGAPNLTDNIWLYGGSEKIVTETIAKGRNGQMPPHKEFLGEDKVHLLAAYVYSLSTGELGEEE